MELIYDEETGLWDEYEPYRTLYISTEEDWEIFEEAIKKQQAQKPEYEGDGLDENGNIIYDTAYCPICHREFEVDYEKWMDYCPKCGQKLDWSEESEV